MNNEEEKRKRGEEESNPARTRVKICGITNLADAQEAVRLGADALGFICVPDTPRYVTIETAFEIGKTIPPMVSKIAVVRDWADVRERMPRYYDSVQYYTNEQNITMVRQGYSKFRRIRAYRIGDEASLEEIAQTYHEAFALLLDTYHKDKLGGAGETFNWEIAVEAKKRFGLPIILAGGLTSENVGEAIRQVHPYAVDVSSGVEAEPGRKDWAKLAAFLEAVRQADTMR